MAKSITFCAGNERRLLPLAPALLIGAAAAPLLAPTPASAGNTASNTGCFLKDQTSSNPLAIQPTSKQPFEVLVNGTPYLLCTVYGPFKDYLDAYLTDKIYAPWYTNGASDAEAFAQAITSSFPTEINASTDRLYKSINEGPINNGNGNTKTDFSSAYFLWANASKSNGRQEWVTAYQDSNGNPGYKINSKFKPDPDKAYWYFYADPVNGAPGPLPLLGAGAAFGWSRRLRRRLLPAPVRPQPIGSMVGNGPER